MVSQRANTRGKAVQYGFVWVAGYSPRKASHLEGNEPLKNSPSRTVLRNSNSFPFSMTQRKL